MSHIAAKSEKTYPRRQGAPTKRGGLALFRSLANLTQVELAEKMGVAQGRISEIESSGDEMKLATIRAYAESMGYELEVCFTKNNMRRRAL
jgi:transcriptional regulator with XRE-family HTH domain